MATDELNRGRDAGSLARRTVQVRMLVETKVCSGLGK